MSTESILLFMTNAILVASKAVSAIRPRCFHWSAAKLGAGFAISVNVKIRPVTSATCEMQMRLQAISTQSWRSTVAKSR